MSDLLNPSESHEFHSFLSSIDYTAPNDARSNTSPEWHHYSSDIPQLKGKEALTKATKDLMSLDSSPWGSSPSINDYQNSSYNFGSHPPHSSQYGFEASPSTSHNPPYRPQHRHSITTTATSPSLSKQRPFHRLDQRHPPIHTAPTQNGSAIRPNSASSPIGTSSTSTSSFSSHKSSAGTSKSALSSAPNSDTLRATNAPENKNCNNKRTLDSSSQSSISKRHRPSPPSAPGTTTKSTLLSPSQKKANHIQSEQKRRANIRRGYEALCETVPALREAIKQEQETQQVNGVSISNGPMKPRRSRGRGKVDEGTGEKIDGRAGPRSENIVLSKTIDYINDLLRDREALLARLRQAKLSLGPHHPSELTSDSTPLLWERIWNGGSGKDADVEDDEEEDDYE